MLLFGIVMLTLGSVLPDLMSRYRLDEVAAGSLASLLPAGIMFGSLVFGPIVDRFSYKYLLAFSALAIAGGLFGISNASGLSLLQISFFMIGLGGGSINGGTNALVADISHDRQSSGSANLSLLGVFFGVGALLVPLIMTVLSKKWSYDQILEGLSALILLIMIYMIAIRYPTAKQQQRVALGKSFSLFKNKALLLLAFLLFFQSAFEGVFNNWTTTFLRGVKSFNESSALATLSIYVIGLTLTRLLLAKLLRVISDRKVVFISLILLMLGSFAFKTFDGVLWVHIGAALLGVGTAAIFPVVLGHVSEMYEEMRGTAFSVVIFIAVLGNTIINFLVGFLAKYFGFGLYPWMLLFCSVCILLLFIQYDRRREQTEDVKGG